MVSTGPCKFQFETTKCWKPLTLHTTISLSTSPSHSTHPHLTLHSPISLSTPPSHSPHLPSSLDRSRRHHHRARARCRYARARARGRRECAHARGMTPQRMRSGERRGGSRADRIGKANLCNGSFRTKKQV